MQQRCIFLRLSLSAEGSLQADKDSLPEPSHFLRATIDLSRMTHVISVIVRTSPPPPLHHMMFPVFLFQRSVNGSLEDHAWVSKYEACCVQCLPFFVSVNSLFHNCPSALASVYDMATRTILSQLPSINHIANVTKE